MYHGHLKKIVTISNGMKLMWMLLNDESQYTDYDKGRLRYGLFGDGMVTEAKEKLKLVLSIQKIRSNSI